MQVIESPGFCLSSEDSGNAVRCVGRQAAVSWQCISLARSNAYVRDSAAVARLFLRIFFMYEVPCRFSSSSRSSAVFMGSAFRHELKVET